VEFRLVCLAKDEYTSIFSFRPSLRVLAVLNPTDFELIQYGSLDVRVKSRLTHDASLYHAAFEGDADVTHTYMDL
jgi:hypothetical protein